MIFSLSINLQRCRLGGKSRAQHRMGNAEKKFMSRTEIMIGDGLASLDRFVQSVTEDLGYQVRVTTGSGSSRRSGLA